ncbi:GNAT family N-acetyltransferase [Pseudomonas sp. KSR10]|uniref:GNAT family N-acetyltransferase n=1 Tax=Pseudomonas sp. KSR10 TaxID=2916654 RepID=UPI001EF76CC5|nr:GNAT family N-acetyltransferase [Pseudomonas sp. KSR10]MCG6540832.1 GNAT family N-acetyltransferase [Pseudomonas sp. KSR10]
MTRIELDSPRLRLRRWHDDDLESLAAMCADPLVMRYFPALLSRDDCAAALARWRMHFARHGFGVWALERKDDGCFIGLTGLAWSRLKLPFCPAVEIAWRLVPDQWRQGLAREAAQAALTCAFDRLQLSDVVAYTAANNEPSRQLMSVLGMQHEAQHDFEHPDIPEGHPLRDHVLYRITRENWADARR